MAKQLSPEERYKEPLEKLVQYGNFSIVDGSVEGMKKLDPKKRAQRNMFLTEAKNKPKRKELKERLKKWHELLSSSEELEAMINGATEKVNKSEKLLNDNIKNALAETKELEQAYRTIDMFFSNAKTDKIKNLTILNADMKQLNNPDLKNFRKAVKSRLEWAHGKVGKKENYSLMVVPGFIGDNTILSEWTEMAEIFKVMLLTDFRDLYDHEQVIEEYDEYEFPAANKTNVIMTCNWLVGRKAMIEVGEEEGVYLPPSAALAGMIYDPNVPLSQPRAGRQYGQMVGASGVRFPLLQEHIGHLDQKGLVPMINEFGVVMPYSARTLFNGDNTGLKTYSVVMVFDWVGKVITDFLNRAAFENANTKMLNDYRSQIARFLNSIKGPGKLIKDFRINEFAPDHKEGQPDRIKVHIVMEPYFPAKSFAIKLDGTKGGPLDDYKWDTNYDEA